MNVIMPVYRYEIFFLTVYRQANRAVLNGVKCIRPTNLHDIVQSLLFGAALLVELVLNATIGQFCLFSVRQKGILKFLRKEIPN